MTQAACDGASWLQSTPPVGRVAELESFRPRQTQDGTELDRSLLRRIRENLRYEPPNLSREFRYAVKNLKRVPEILFYRAV
jgi:hypothetical protein